MTDPMVYIASAASRASTRVYHTDLGCRFLPDRYSEWKIDDAESWNYRECSYCSGNQADKTPNKDLYNTLVAIGEGCDTTDA